MSYSRWGTSRWYTFWCSSLTENKVDELFDVDCQFQFTYGEIKRDVDACLEKVAEEAERGEPTEEELEELRGYMLAFIEDVDADYEV